MKISKLLKGSSTLLLMLFLIGSQHGYAQKKGEVGIRFMPTISDFDMITSESNTVSGEATVGFGAGIFLAYNFTNHIGVQGELIYSTITQRHEDIYGEKEVTLKYFNVPLLLSLNSGKDKSINFNVCGGLQLGINVGSDVSSTSSGDSTSLDAVLSVKNSDIGFAYGAGLDFRLNESKTIRLGLGFRNVIGLADISDNSATANNDSYYIIDKTHLKTYSAYVGLSLMF